MSTARATVDGAWSAPGRVNLIGEHTDYNDGFVLPFAIDRRTRVVLAARDDGMVRVRSELGGDPVELPLAALRERSAADLVPEWARYPFGIIWALSQHGADLPGSAGFDAAFSSDLPTGAGLSSSAAIECSLALALNDAWGLGLDRPDLARVGQQAENEFVGAPTGIMDQTASLLGRDDAAVFLDCRSLDSQIVPLGLVAAGLSILVIDTGVKHEHATGGYRERRADCERGARELGVASLRDVSVGDLERAATVLDDVTFRRVRHVVTENQRVLDTVAALRESGPTAIGPILDASHRSMRDDFEISVPELDLAVDAAQRAGASGARMTGGGFGGSAIALVADGLVPAVETAVTAAFAAAGFGTPHSFVVRPSEGARVEG